MKKLFVCALLVLITCGCGKNSKINYEKEFEQLATSYYEKYQISNGLDIAEITLGDLKYVNETMGEIFNLSKVSKCKDESVVRIYIKRGTTQIEKYEFDLKCS